MGILATKLQVFNAAKSTCANTQAVKTGEKCKCNVKKPVPKQKRFYQGCGKKPSPTKAQTPLVKVNQKRNLGRFSHYRQLYQKLHRKVQEENEKSTTSTTSTSSDDLDSW